MDIEEGKTKLEMLKKSLEEEDTGICTTMFEDKDFSYVEIASDPKEEKKMIEKKEELHEAIENLDNTLGGLHPSRRRNWKTIVKQ